MEAVLHAPVGAHGAGEGLGVHERRTEGVSPREGGLALDLHLGFDPGDGLEAWEAGLAGRGPVGAQPGDIGADNVSARLDAAVAASMVWNGSRPASRK